MQTASQIELWPHQEANSACLLDQLYHQMVAADSSDTGTGKTATALEAARRFGLPFVVVSPKSVRSHWHHWIRAFGLESQCLGVLGWEQAKLGKAPEIYSAGKWFNRDGVRRLILFDEAHRAKNAKSLCSSLVRSASESGLYLILLSATLIQSCLDLAGLAYPLKLIAHQRYWFRFAQQYGATIHPRFGGYYDNSNLGQQLALGRLLDRVRVRTRREEIAGIQACCNQVDLVDSTKLFEIRALYAGLDRKVRELEILGSAAVEIFTERLRARQAIELLKTQVFVEQALEHLDQGNKVALFFNFTESVNDAALGLMASEIKCGVITGETSTKERDRLIAGFNRPDKLTRALALSINAGAEGLNLQDTDGRFPRIGLLSPPESSMVLIQALGRIGGRVGAKSVGLNRVLFVSGTVEEEVYDNLRRKIKRLESLQDSDLVHGTFQ